MTKRVLLAEDEPNIVESLTFILERSGFDVSVTTTGREALEQAQSAIPDILILDVMLPLLNGFEVLRRLRADPATTGLPVIMLTAKGQAQDRRTAEDIGADAFITKPFSNRDVVDHVHRLISG